METLNSRKFRILIAEHGYSIHDLAKTTGISKTTIHKWLNGSGAQLKTLGKVAKVLDMPLVDFMQAVS